MELGWIAWLGCARRQAPDESGKKNKKKTTKMLGISVLIAGVSDSPNSSKVQLVIAGSKNI